MSTHICLNSSERYVLVWRSHHYGAYYWITSASLRRLLRLVHCIGWHKTPMTGEEFLYSRDDTV